MDEHRQGVATNGARAESRSEQGWGKDNSIVGVNLMCRHHRWYKRLFYNGRHVTANHMPSQSYESLNALIYTFGWRIIERGPAPENEE